jgi:hypothetical protein
MPGFLVFLFWCWFGVSCVILVRRLGRKVGGTNRAGTTTTSRSPVTWPPLPPDARTANDVAPTDDAGHADDAAPAPGTATAAVPDAAAPKRLTDALDGIRLPCDLAPLAARDAGLDFDRRAAFYTVGYPAEAVAPSIADELERLGMEFNSLSDSVAVATRNDLRVRVAVRSVGSAARNGVADLDYPTAPEHCVVVEFELT